ncbi:CHAT domain-containing protein [Catellatospora bangladeshensis]|uniref:CHAT domain-containing protein n=2 Tax=Catellatospora bangladeshensis TaxID=310355 RepID=A0A8J3NL81_9ACTN|nr:CHAT domain-containing protein [Catellatospora bangladeshensis]GIF85240.1 hypothetical protein Cba03nite_65890 [Catellatospora bangladeshensis]
MTQPLDRRIAELDRLLAAAGTPEEHWGLRNDRATLYWTRYEEAGRLPDLEHTIAEFRAVLTAGVLTGSAALPTMSNLAGALTLRAKAGGGPADLREAVELLRTVVAGTPAADARHGGRLLNLGGVLLGYHHATGDSAVLHEACSAFQAAHDAAPEPDTPERREHWVATRSNLGECLRLVHTVTGEAQTLDRAVALARAAAGALPTGHPLYARMQSNLALALVSAAHAGQPEVLAEAAAAARAALAATPGGHPNEPERHTVYAGILRATYASDPDPVLLNQFRRAARGAVRATPAAHPNAGWARLLLGRAEYAHADRSGQEPTAARELFRDTAQDLALPPGVRAVAARHWSLLAFLDPGRLAEAVRAFGLAVALLPQTAGRERAAVDAERLLGEHRHLAADAAACALTAGDPGLALRLLEQGRGVLLSQTLDTWADVTDLAARHPALAAEFTELRGLTRAEPTPAEGVAAGVAAAEERAHLARRWSALVDRIRAVPGHEGFLAPPSLPELLAAGRDGPVAVVNVSGLRCDALLVRDGRVEVLPLPELTLDGAEAAARRFLAAVTATGSLAEVAAAGETVREILGWLWRTVTGPVLAALGVTGPGGTPARMWWMPCGPLAFLPLHAAEDGWSALDAVVSSYTPTLRSLCHHRDRAVPPGAVDGPLVVAMPHTPAAPPLPHAVREAETVAALYPGAHLLSGAAATGEQVLAELARRRWAHFACHAAGRADQPGLSRLLLYDHDRRPLTVRELSRAHLPHAELAYLSACATSHPARTLPDEAVHLTGAFHLAGYGQVVGTLWRVADDVAADVTAYVHERLAADAAAYRPLDAATALHGAVRRLRDRYPAAAALWAAHVHVGR